MQKLNEKSLMGETSVEDSIYEDALMLVRKTLDRLVGSAKTKAPALTEDEIDVLAKLVRIYGSLKEDLRADMKDGIKNASST